MDFDSDVIEVAFNVSEDSRMNISINITDDDIDERDEAFALDIINTNTTFGTVQIIGPTTAFGIIMDNDEPGMYINIYTFV